MRVLVGVTACVALAVAPAVGMAGGGVAPPPASGRYAVYPQPYGGLAVGGRMTVAPGGKLITSLEITFPPSIRYRCGASAWVLGKLHLRNLTGINNYKIRVSDWFYGRWSSVDGNLQSTRVTLGVNGKRVAGQLSLVFINSGAHVPATARQPDGGQLSYAIPGVGAPCLAPYAVKRAGAG